jgi:predicted acylesterase/phospholipase RssA
MTSSYDTIVLGGSSINGILLLGALQFLYENDKLLTIDKYIGTSSGAIISYLLIIGYKPIDVIIYLVSNNVFTKMDKFSLENMFQGKGAYSATYIFEHLKQMTLNKIGYIPTLNDLYTKFNKVLVLITYNMTLKQSQEISHSNYGDLDCLTALRMTSNLPFIFDNFFYNDMQYMDGGVCNNFPIDVAYKLGTSILGLVANKRQLNFNSTNTLDYIFNILLIPVIELNNNKLKSIQDKQNHKIYYIKCNKVNFVNFNIDSTIIQELFSEGYSQFKNDFIM